MAIREYVKAAKEAPKHRPLSQVFAELFTAPTGPMALETIRDYLADRSYGALLLFFAAINCLPLPPGSSSVLAIPLLLLSAQMVMGLPKPWLPARILRVEVPAHLLVRFNDLAGRWLAWFEKFVRPRYWPFSNRSADIAIGMFILIMSLILWLPIPFFNWVPAIAVFVFSLALIERDGLVFAIGVGLTGISLGFVGTVASVGAAAAKAAMHWLF